MPPEPYSDRRCTGAPAVTNLVKEIDRFLLSRESRERQHHYASDILACRRQLYYKWTREPESNPIEAGGHWKMRMGDRIHELVHEFLEEAGFDIIREVSGKLEHPRLKRPISYRVDNLFTDRDGTVAGIEVKTSYGAGIKALKSDPKPDHLGQVVVYMRAAAISRFYLLYIGRDNGFRRQFTLELRDGTLLVNGRAEPDPFESMIDRLVDLERRLETHTVPARDYLAAIRKGSVKDRFQKNKEIFKTDWQCSYCRWKDACWQEVAEQHRDGDNADMFTSRRSGTGRETAPPSEESDRTDSPDPRPAA